MLLPQSFASSPQLMTTASWSAPSWATLCALPPTLPIKGLRCVRPSNLIHSQASLCQLEKAESVVLEPLNNEYLEIQDTRATFESFLRQNYSTMSIGSIVSVPHQTNQGGFLTKLHPFLVKQLSPQAACVITDTDLNVDIVPKDLDDGYQAIIHKKNTEMQQIREIGWKGPEEAYASENISVQAENTVYLKVRPVLFKQSSFI